jgi:hypothetical protein
MAGQHTDLDQLSAAELGELARQALTALAHRGTQEAFAELLSMNAHVGQCLGDAARTLAANGSWSQVADLSGTTKQAAWSRWRTSSDA